MAKHQFNTEISQILNLMINSLYSNKEIFLRELVSNASDALDKLNYLSLTDEKFKDLDYTPQINIVTDKEAKTLTISDSGIGMSEKDLKDNLGTIAKSGTKAFIDSMSGDKKKDSALIGQFGVGFYASFMVADKIEVISKKAGAKSANKWTSSAGDSYELAAAKKDSHGTDIVLHIKKDMEEFLDDFRIENIIHKFSDHVPYKIFLNKTTKDDKDVEKTEDIQINKATALWRMSKSETKASDYKDFYKQIAHDSSDPVLHIHTKAEGVIEYSTLFYIPSTAPFDLFRVDFTPGVKLYVKRVFITDDEKELLPLYLRFVKGIIDAEDLPLNVSREILQENVILTKIKDASVKKILGELKKLKEKDSDKYLEFYKVFGKVIKEGLHSDFVNRERILDLLLFKSSKKDSLVSLKEYKENMKEDQKEIFYITGNDENMLKHSPLIEKFKAKDLEVLIMDDDVDAIVMPMVDKFDSTPFKNVSQVKFDDEKVDEKKQEEDEKKYSKLIVSLKEILKDDIKDVKISSRLSDSAVCLVNDENDPDFQTQMMLKQMGQGEMNIKPILEINPNHEIFDKIVSGDKLNELNIVAPLLLNQAKMLEGMEITKPVDFADSLNKIMIKAL